MAIVVETPEDQQIQEITTDLPVTNPNDVQLQVEYLFASSVWRTSAPQFLEAVQAVVKTAFSKRKKEHPEILKTVYPTIMTDNIHTDPRCAEFANYIQQAAWNVLNNQGYNMDIFDMQFYDCFGQEHHKYSGHDTHTHPGGQVTGFYFLETPENCCRVVFKDPRHGKNHNSIGERNMSQATLASYEINYQPQPGDFFFTNSWLPHSFTRNANIKPMRFIHFTLGVQFKGQPVPTEAATVV